MIIDSKYISDDDMKQINKYTRKDYTRDDIYAFEITLCNDDLDADYEVISKDSLYKLKDLSIGTTGFLTPNITARIFDAYIEKVITMKSNSRLQEEEYTLKAKAYVSKNTITEEALNQILNHPQISVGFSVKQRVCSICYSSKCCKHIKGRKYIDEVGIERLCYKTLYSPTDFYEWSIIPKQQESKSNGNKPKENKVATAKTKLMINGKLTDVELDENGGITIIHPKKKVTGWERTKGETYIYCGASLMGKHKDSARTEDDDAYNRANYFSDEKLYENIYRMQQIQRKLFRWQAENDVPINPYDNNKAKYYIMYCYLDKNNIGFYIRSTYSKNHGFLPYFSSEYKAIECITQFEEELRWLFTEFQWRMDYN